MSLQTTLNNRITTLRKSEKITKAELGLASREVLSYLLFDENPHDIGMLNRLVDALTPMNKKTLTLFAQHFLPYKYDENAKQFGKLNKKQLEAKSELVKTFLESGDTIWDWAAAKVDLRPKAPDYAKKIKSDITKALQGNEEQGVEPMTKADVFGVILDSGIDIDDILNLLEQMDVVNVVDQAA